jgi:hypothetical protein
MKRSTALILAASFMLPSIAPALLAAQPSSECGPTCDHEKPAAPAASHVIQTVARQPSPGNKFPMPAAEQPRQQQTSGTLAIRARQGTPGAAAIGPVPVEIELYHRGNHINTIDAHLDEHGVALIEQIPIAMGLQPLIKIAYSGVTYQKVGDIMDPSRPHQMVEVICYELTEEAPPWSVNMRHVMVSLAPDGVEVTEVMVLNNPTQQTWIGKPRTEGKSITTQFLLPPEAASVTLGRGFHEWCCSTLAKDRIENHLPLTPGATEMIYAYFLPARKGSITLDIATLAKVDHLMVIVPSSLQTASSTGLTPGGSESMGDTTVRMYTAATLAPGQPGRLVLTGLGGQEALAAGTIAKIIAGVGGALVLLVGGFLIFARAPKPKAAAPSPMPAAH